MPIAGRLNGTLRAFIEKQPMFFVATAAPQGAVNVSPKGLESLRVLSEDRIVWLNVSGSGNETAAHVREANRMTMMFCAFSGDPLVLRVYGSAETVHPRDDSWDELSGLFPAMAGSRQIFDVRIDRVQTSCGTGVPFMAYEGQRGESELLPYYADMGPSGVQDYWRRKNVTSIDGKPTGLFPTT